MSLIQIEERNTVKTNDVTLPLLARSEDGRAIATFPDFQFAVHPEYIYEGGMQALDRANGQLSTNDAGAAILTGQFPNGALGFDLKAQNLANPASNRIVSPRRVNIKEFSIALAVYYVFNAPPTTSHNLAASISGLTTNFRLVINPGRYVSMINPTGAGCADPVQVPSGVPTVYTACYSDGKGATLYRGQTQVNSGNVDFGRDADELFYTVTSAAGFLNVCDEALNSPYYITSIDLSKPENDARRAALIKGLTDIYVNT